MHKQHKQSGGSLRALTALIVFHNRLAALPASIGSLQALSRLDVEDNQLTSLPASIGELKALTVNTKGNLADELPYE